MWTVHVTMSCQKASSRNTGVGVGFRAVVKDGYRINDFVFPKSKLY